MKWYKQVHWQIMIGLILGLIWGLLSSLLGFNDFTSDYVKPFGTIFINLLKLIAIPLVLASLVVGVTSLRDIAKLSRMGGKMMGMYVVTTILAIMIGLIVVNLWRPGDSLPESTKTELINSYTQQTDDTGTSVVEKRKSDAQANLDKGPLQFFVNMVPTNLIESASNNINMLQIVFVAVFLGIGIIQIPEEKGKSLIAFFDALNDAIIEIINIIMKGAPIGVFALIASVIVDLAGDDLMKAVDLLWALGSYCSAVIFGLAVHVLLVYSGLFKLFTNVSLLRFFKGIKEAMLLGFSTSSSSATLPVTMESVEKNLGVDEEVSSFVLPIGATINMNGTSLYQSVAAVFIAQALGLDLSIGQQLTIVLTATLASVGAAGVPGAGIIMLVIVLQSINVPVEGIALILGVDRIMDMCRTLVNITGDSAVAVAVAHSEGLLHEPEVEKVDLL